MPFFRLKAGRHQDVDPGFKIKTAAQLAKMSPEERAEYQEERTKNRIRVRQAARQAARL
jgi:hypothetical protein